MDSSPDVRRLTLLSIAGSDPTARAGVFLDLRVFAEYQAHGVAIITAVTAQNAVRVFDTRVLDQHMINLQASAILSEYDIDAVKIGMLGNEDVCEAVAELVSQLPGTPVVLDPVLVSTSGYDMLERDAMRPMVSRLFPLVTVVTPNIMEAEMLTNHRISTLESTKEAARVLTSMGARAVVIKGGHSEGDDSDDLLFDRSEFHLFRSEKKSDIVSRGKGCIFSSALAANLGRGDALAPAVQTAKNFVVQFRD